MADALEPLTPLGFAGRIGLALALGSLVGVERQYRQCMAGLRTNALVATGAALFVTITPLVGAGANPTQIASYVVSGIGFLAGGVIFKERASVSGLNTAATLWCTAALGALSGFGLGAYAAIGAAAELAANVVLRPVVRLVNRRPIDGTEVVTSYEIRTVCRADAEDRTRTATVESLRGTGMSLLALYGDDVEATDRVEITADVSAMGTPSGTLEKVMRRLGVEPGVTAVSWRAVPTSDDERELVTEA